MDLGQFRFHVIAQIIEPKFVIGRVGDITLIRRVLFVLWLVGDNNASGHAKRCVHLGHPFGITRRKVIVHGNDMHALACQRI